MPVPTEQKSKQLLQMAKFTLFSISAGIVELGVFTLLTECTDLGYWVCYLTALILSVLWNFTFNRRYTFRSAANVPEAMLLVFAFYAVFTPVTTVVGNWLEGRGINEYIVLGGTMVLNFITEYFYQRYVVYRDSIDTRA